MTLTLEPGRRGSEATGGCPRCPPSSIPPASAQLSLPPTAAAQPSLLCPQDSWLAAAAGPSLSGWHMYPARSTLTPVSARLWRRSGNLLASPRAGEDLGALMLCWLPSVPSPGLSLRSEVRPRGFSLGRVGQGLVGCRENGSLGPWLWSP